MKMASMSPYLSKKLAFLSFFGIVMVVFIHASVPGGEVYRNYALMTTIINVVTPIFKPLFFAISGYLFFCGVDGLQAIGAKLKKRFFTLMIPYVLTNLLAYCAIGVLKMLPATAKFVNASVYLGHNSGLVWYQIPVRLFITPYMFHLWFVKTLIIVLLLTPLLFFCLRKKCGGAIFVGALAAVCLLQEFGLVPAVFATLNLVTADLCFALFAFSFGGFIVLNYPKLTEARADLRHTATSLLGLVAAAVASILSAGRLIDVWFFLLFVFSFMAYDIGWLQKMRESTFLSKIIPFTFFIYLFHMPWMNIPKKLLSRLLLRTGGVGYCLTYLLAPIIMIIILLVIAMTAERFLPKTYSLLTGGRGSIVHKRIIKYGYLVDVTKS